MDQQITFDKRNYRKHSEKNKAIIRKSLQELGAGRSVLIDKDGALIAGNGVYEQAQKLNIPVRVIETDGTELVAVKRTDIAEGDEKRKRLALADNVASDLGEFDDDLLHEDFSMEELSDWGLEIEEEVSETKEAQEDDFDEEKDKVETVCKKGDIWQLGNHRLMCGDSTNAEDVARLMDGKKADMCFTDPPYGYKYQSNFRKRKFDVLENDDQILNFFPLLKLYVNGFIFICTSYKVLREWLELFDKHYELTNIIIWDKGGASMGDLAKTFSTDYEMIFVSNGGREITGKRIGSVWSINRDGSTTYIHPTQKPVGLSALAIQNTTLPNEIVIDLFGGSGSTLIACEQLGRKCYMMELDPHYCDVIIARWEKLTGQKAIRL